MKIRIWVAIVALTILLITFGIKFSSKPAPIGGERDEYGCLTAGGYSFSEEAGACVREFDVTSDIKRAIGLATEYLGRGYGLTVVSFNSYEEFGSYDITFEVGAERERRIVYIKNWQVVESPKE